MCAPLLPLTRRGAVTGADLWGKLLTLSPLYYVFLLQTRAYHFAKTMRWGGADYFQTSRAISIAHTPFHELCVPAAALRHPHPRRPPLHQPPGGELLHPRLARVAGS